MDKPNPSPSGASAANAPSLPAPYFAPDGTHPDTCPVPGSHTRTACNYFREQLAKYGQHLPGCTQAPSSCSCGLIQAVLAQPMASTPVVAESAAAPRQPEWLQDLTDAEIATAEKLCPPWSTEGRALAEVKRRRARPSAAASLDALRRALRSASVALNVCQGYLLGLGRPNEAADADRWRGEARAALAAAPRDERPGVLPLNRFDCVECGPVIAVDEDGCCTQCGRDALNIGGGETYAAAPRDERPDAQPTKDQLQPVMDFLASEGCFDPSEDDDRAFAARFYAEVVEPAVAAAARAK